ncbi:ferredoxin [Mycobacterium colombiense]|uniref:ferredoxin n=1 Tax=Mycobacterium colombiense TaxID=339268 RepID=UPI0007ECCEAD|nr:ferredoxin [Mycobacterium colombiense]OBJ12991.1 ferredoxin [Mycobacterium colombiense]OBJ24716.1 ferredoxin [Mycobacterium colombiense]OBJ44707.1 ferredoxin [Mycobacterium colombiense]OBJ78397.1 ferredoxin [Mycobacterium colombiense]
MKLHVDRETCQGHSRCYAAYPELFDIDDEGTAFVTMEDIPSGWEDRAHNAIANCPERAIHILKESP